MSRLYTFWQRLSPFRRPSPVDRYRLTVVTTAAELAVTELLPLELRYLIACQPARFEQFRQLLEAGFGIGVRIVDKTPERILRAVDIVSHETQRNTVLPWLERLLRSEELPVFSVEELERTSKKGINLYEEIKVILAQRFEFTKIVLVDLHNQCITSEQQRLVRELNVDLFPIVIQHILHRVVFDNAHTRTEVAQSIIKALILVGPAAHALEHFLSGLGKVFAASVDDILSEVAELFALRGSGFTWRQLMRRSRILIPVFFLAVYGAFQVEPLIQSGRVALAGVVFGLSAVALSLVTALQSIFMYREAFHRLAAEGKLRLDPGQTVFGLALRQDFTNPARLGLFLGALASPFVSAIIFSSFPQLLSNGWVLAILGSVESIVAGGTVFSAKRLERWFFASRARRQLSRLGSRHVTRG